MRERPLVLGGFEIEPVVEIVGPVRPPAEMFVPWCAEAWERRRPVMEPEWADPVTGHYVSSVQSWLLRREGLTVLVDAGVGDGKERPDHPRYHRLATGYLDRLRAVGVAPEDVDLLVLTHLHVDHVGWATRRTREGWRPTFPNARCVVARRELDDFLDLASSPVSVDDVSRLHADTILPLQRHGAIEAVASDARLAPGLRLEPAPGHTAGQVAVRLGERGSDDGEGLGREAVVTADVMHHPIQVYEPTWNSRFCALPEAARATRARLLAEAADTGLVLLPGHFGQRHAWTVRREGGSFVPVPFDPVEREGGRPALAAAP